MILNFVYKMIILSVNIPSKLVRVEVKFIKDLKVSFEGLRTNTPELKQSGHPTSGAAENSS